MTEPVGGPEAAVVPADAEPGSGSTRERWRTFGAPALAAVTIVSLCLGVLLGWVAFGPHRPADSSADAGFARDMSEHHAQAVEMSQLVMQRTDDEAVRRLAVDIDNNQGFERGMMATWLGEWGLPRARGEARMAWMGTDHMDMDLPPGVAMAGMASPTELQQLTEASGEEAEVLFLQLMLTHHLAGVEMAEAALDLAEDPRVLAAAERMSVAQVGEIRLMNDMLVERGSQPREDVSAWLEDGAAATAPAPGATQDLDLSTGGPEGHGG
ncbi:DUF305 domain-containing protein [Ornithinimicrobium avium]|uniref:DUF305 domain-containing protein n=1 Tax=Ornithinimicrobium avium TaxID=2283195 RepID=A0A345NLI6_9MICO|nr:DUF305 domain-containing protein [Ornithinimicrobium avium]AXH95894.1 DUF305 domain-containing protein [Ornithinimicrobium avium]